MKARATILTLALCFVGVGVCFAADTLMGTWKLNEASEGELHIITIFVR